MPLHLPSKYWLMALAPISVACTAIAWSGQRKGNHENNYYKQDTIPSKNHKTAKEKNRETNEKDLDKEMKELDKAIEEIDGKLEKIDWKKMEQDIESSLKQIEEIADHRVDIEKMEKEIEESMKKIDFEKIERETRLAMQQAADNIDFKKMEEDLQKSLREVNACINSEEFRKSLDAAGKIDIQKIKQNIEHARLDLEKNKVNMKAEIDKARKNIAKAKEEMKAYQEMLDEMEKDGLINTKEDYTIEYKNNELYINKQKQAQDVLGKYQKYFKEDNTRIYKKNGRFNINID